VAQFAFGDYDGPAELLGWQHGGVGKSGVVRFTVDGKERTPVCSEREIFPVGVMP
jgi:hypothetical protein